MGYRYILYVFHPSKPQIQYFKDRCPGMIEEQIRKMEGFIPFKTVEYNKLDFIEIIPADSIIMEEGK